VYRGCGVVKSTRKMVMSLAGIILFSIWVSLCVAVIGGWAFKTLDDDVIPNWDDEVDEFDDAEEQGNLL
jgi:hypothetical protein